MPETPPPSPGQQLHYLHYQLPSHSSPLLILWSVITTLISLPGNTVILISTIKHDAIKLDEISLLLIKHLAVSDILNTLLVIMPGVATLSLQRALFSDNRAVCQILAYSQYIFPTFNSLAVAALTINKLVILLKPTQSLTRSNRTGHVIVGAAWLCGLVPALLYIAVGGTTVMFDTRVYRCMPNWNGSPNEVLWKMLDNIKAILFVFIPFMMIMITTIWMLSFVKRYTTLGLQNVSLILSVGILHLISFIPFLLYVILMNVLKPPAEVKYQDDTVAQLYATAVYLNYLNTMSNPVLYYFTSSSFKTYITEWARKWWSKVRGQEGVRGSALELNTVSSRETASGLSGNRGVKVETSVMTSG